MKKSKLLMVLLIVTLGVVIMSFTASAEVYSGECGAEGDNVTWTLDTETGVLEISGEGQMEDYEGSFNVPWNDNKIKIKKIVIEGGVTNISGTAFLGCLNLTSVTIPDSVTSIGSGAFMQCPKLKNLTIPNSVTTIEAPEILFAYDSALESIVVNENNEYYASEDGVLFNKDKTNLLSYPGGKTDSSYKTPSTVESISAGAFMNNMYIEELIVSENVTSINNGNFVLCFNLIDVYFYNPDIGIDVEDDSIYLAYAKDYNNWLNFREEFIQLMIEGAICGGGTEQQQNRFDELCGLILTEESQLNPCGTIHGYAGSTAEAYANSYNIDFKLIIDQTDEDTDIGSSYDEDVFPTGTVMLIDKKGQNTDGTFNGNYKYYESYDISFVDENNKEVQPNGTVSIRIPVPHTFNPEKTAVFYVAPDGTTTKLNSWHEGRYIVFEVDHFSEYVIVDESSLIENDTPEQEPEEESKNFFEIIYDFLMKILDLIKSLFK